MGHPMSSFQGLVLESLHLCSPLKDLRALLTRGHARRALGKGSYK